MSKQYPKQAETLRARQQNALIRNIHQAIIAADAELGLAVDTQYRQRLVKAAYALRDLEESIRLESADYSGNLGLRRLPEALTVPKEKNLVTTR